MIYIQYQDDCDVYLFNSFEEIENYDKVVYICCDDNQLCSLPKLPDLIKSLYCRNNQLSVLPNLPNSLKKLRCENNKIIQKEKYKYKYLIKIMYM